MTDKDATEEGHHSAKANDFRKGADQRQDRKQPQLMLTTSAEVVQEAQ
jgi:hypothetical protein